MKKYAVIVAGGTGSRMGTELPKQFMLIHDRPVLFYTIDVFLRAYDDLSVILVLPEEHIDKGQEIIDAWFDKERIRICVGGDSRFQSVKNGLAQVEEESIVFVHDGVRCLPSIPLIHRCYDAASDTGSAIPVVASRDSVRILEEDDSKAIDRHRVMLVQTPQTFHSKILIPAFQIDYKEWFTDEATVAEAFGLKVTLVAGEENNIKLTYPSDIYLAEKLLKPIGV